MNAVVTTYKAVYIGVRLGKDTPLIYAWRKVNDAGEVTEDTVYFGKGKKRSTFTNSFIGEVYEFDEDGEGTTTIKSGSRTLYSNKEQIGVWKIESQAAELKIKLDKEAKEDTMGEACLKELKEKYHTLVGRTHRSAYLATIIQFITK